MNTRGFFLGVLISLIAVNACIDQKEAQYAKADEQVEVKFNVFNKNTKSPEYELTFYSGGKVIARRKYKNGRTLVSEGTIPDGQVVEKYENGNIKNAMYYRNGKREGKATGYYQSGKIKIEAMYKNDNPVGISRSFYENGQLKSESKIDDGKKIFYKEYYRNGQLKKKVYYKNGQGISKTYDINGKLIEY